MSEALTRLPEAADSLEEPGEPAASDRARSPWGEFAIKRGLGLLATVGALIVITFLIVRLIPGDPAREAAGTDASPEQVEAVRADLGLDLPVWRQFLDYVAGLLQGDLGQSFSLQGSVTEIIGGRLPYTAGIALSAMAIVLLLAIPLGMAVGVLTRGGRRSWLDQGFSFVTGLVAAIPGYVMATFLILIFPVTLQLLYPAFSQLHPAASLVLPVVALAIGPICVVSRVVRREIAVVLEQDFMRTARGWRLGTVRLYGKYAFPSLLTSTLTLSGLILTSMLGSAIIVETVFGVPGLGTSLVKAILTRDYPLIQGIVLVIGTLAALLTLLVDVLLGLIDPRTLGGKHE